MGEKNDSPILEILKQFGIIYLLLYICYQQINNQEDDTPNKLMMYSLCSFKTWGGNSYTDEEAEILMIEYMTYVAAGVSPLTVFRFERGNVINLNEFRTVQ